MNILLTCSNGKYAGDAIDLISKIDYVQKIYRADIKQSKYKLSSNLIVPHGSEPDYLESILKICLDNNIEFIIPGSDKEIISISKNLDLLKKNNIRTFCQSSEIVTLLSDKAAFFEKLNHNGIPIDFYIPLEWQDLNNYKDRLDYINPEFLIVKPRTSSGSKGVWLVDLFCKENFKIEIIKDRTFKSDLQSCIKHMEDKSINPNSYLVQPYYGAEVYDVDNLFIKNEEKLFQVCRKRVYRDEFSPVNQGCLITSKKEIELYVKDICKGLQIDGFIDLDIVIDKYKKIHVIDASARLSGSITSSAECGVNFMKLILDYYIKGLVPKELKFEECYVIPYEGFKKLNK